MTGDKPQETIFKLINRESGETLTSFPSKRDYENWKSERARYSVYPIDETKWELREMPNV